MNSDLNIDGQDAVDRINEMRLNGEMKGKRIQDIYDDLVGGIDERRQEDTSKYRMPQFDNVHKDGCNLMHITRDNWKYPNEKVMNGGKITCNLTGYEQMEHSFARGDTSGLINQEYGAGELDKYNDRNWN
jgi:hypothetical protein